MNQKTLYTEILIQAKAEDIWQVLIQTSAYAEWNPFVKSISGQLKKGEPIRVVLEAPGGKPMTFKPRILEFEENRQFKWLGHLFIKGLFDGEHCFEINDLGDGSCRFIQKENFSGVLLPFLKKMLDTQTKKGFEHMNLALKNRVEQANTRSMYETRKNGT